MNNKNIEQARFNMVEQQVRPAEVLDPKVLDIISQVPREQFVPKDYQGLAFSDICIPLANDKCMMKPIQEARMLQALDVQASDKILEIGTGSGFITALLAKLGREVTSVEIDENLHNAAKQALDCQGINNVTLQLGCGAKGWAKNAPYDVIAVTGSMPLLADELKQQLAPGGRCFVIVGTDHVMTALLITRTSETQWSEEALYETELAALENVTQPPAFEF